MQRTVRAALVFSLAALSYLSQRPATAADAAQSYPSRPVRMIVSFAPGGSVDLVARLIGHKLTEAWGQQIVIDNRPGAGGNLSAELAARAAPDGYTLYISSASLVVNVSLYRKVGYDPVKDFAPITLLATVQNVLVAHPSLPAKNVKELIALAKRQPGKINYASTGSGSSGHLTMELFKAAAGIDILHVPYKVIGQARTDILAGQISLWFGTVPALLPHIRSGKLRALAVAGGKRSPALPEVPTVAESGLPGFEAFTWYPVLAPAGTPKARCRQAQLGDRCDLEDPGSARAPDLAGRGTRRVHTRAARGPPQDRARQVGEGGAGLRRACRLSRDSILPTLPEPHGRFAVAFDRVIVRHIMTPAAEILH